DGGANGDSGGRAVLGNGAFGDVDVNVQGAVEIFFEAEGGGARADIAHGGLRGFLHDFAELAGGGQAAFAFHDGGFDSENGASDFGPGEAGHEADFILFF